MRKSLDNNRSNWRVINKIYRNEFADEIVAKISESVDFKKFLQVVFDEKILTERQEEILKLLYGFDDGVERTANQIGMILQMTPPNVFHMRWGAFAKILQSEIYKNLFPEENEENYSFSDEVVKQKREEIFKNLDDDLDNYEYHIDDSLSLEDIGINEEFDIIEMMESQQVRKKIVENVLCWGFYFPNNKKQKDMFVDLYGLIDGKAKTYSEVAERYRTTPEKVKAIRKDFFDKILATPCIREYLFKIWKKEII